jgi:hypothetical protein
MFDEDGLQRPKWFLYIKDTYQWIYEAIQHLTTVQLGVAKDTTASFKIKLA